MYIENEGKKAQTAIISIIAIYNILKMINFNSAL